MKNWKEDYKRKCMSLKEAVSHIRPHDYVAVSQNMAEPSMLMDALVENKELFEDVTIMHMIARGTSPYCQPGMEKYFTHNSFFVGKSTREAVQAGRAVFTPMFMHEIPEMILSGEIKVDVALVHLTRPNSQGFCSFGCDVSYIKAACERARVVIAEVNDQMPWVYGDNFIHVSDIDYMCEVSHPVIETIPAELDEKNIKIGEMCASLIDDGCTIQLGGGSTTSATLRALGNKVDLGVHTEVCGASMIDLVEGGVITGKCKNINRGKVTACQISAEQKHYKYVDNNPMFQLMPCNYTNDPRVIAQNDNMVAINTIIEMDLLGQSTAETIGTLQYSGTGGQNDFLRGAADSKGGKSILVLTSTTKNDTISKIVPTLKPGSALTNLRNDVDYVITEYGIAHLRGLTAPDRAKALIEIAYPKFRDELRDAARDFYKFKI